MSAGWDLIVPHLDAAVADVQRLVAAYDLDGPALVRLRARFTAGAREHADDWTSWTPMRFATERADERDDLIIYTAMWRAAMAARESRP